MEERRKHKRLDLEVMVELERLDEESVTTLKYVHVEVTDISRSGLGFKSKADLEIGSYYDTRIQIWTKEVVVSYFSDSLSMFSSRPASFTAAFTREKSISSTHCATFSAIVPGRMEKS